MTKKRGTHNPARSCDKGQKVGGLTGPPYECHGGPKMIGRHSISFQQVTLTHMQTARLDQEEKEEYDAPTCGLGRKGQEGQSGVAKESSGERTRRSWWFRRFNQKKVKILVSKRKIKTIRMHLKGGKATESRGCLRQHK